ncbi:MAG: hypothetical protein GY809_19640 [Planctomycetes bacterium]|nr:hypothetical protein [Planctomycetota bacterium]
MLKAGDSDADAMDDAWEVRMGLDPQGPAGALMDLDEDGFVNLAEYLHHSDPNDGTVVPMTPVAMIVPDHDPNDDGDQDGFSNRIEYL